MPELSLPSENVPAPPSPNCTLLAGSKAPPDQKRSTSFARASTSRPRSITSGLSPAWARCSAANSPAGPIPTTMGRCAPGLSLGMGWAGSISGRSWAFLGRWAGTRLTSTSSVKEKCTSRLSRASTDFLKMRAETISSGRSFSARAASSTGGRWASFRFTRS